ncbi:MAG: hypothetical protein ABUT20_23240 [Bacteroidota bacterium]
MKKSILKLRFFVLLLLLTGSNAVFAQTFKDYFNEQTPVTYLGVDFTEVKVAGLNDYDLKDLTSRHFSSINNLMVDEKEAKKYDYSKFFHRANTQKDISLTEEHNAKIDPDKIKSTGGADENRFTAASIDKLVKGYNFAGKKGMGILLVPELLSKTKEGGTVYAVFIDMPGKKVLYSEKFSEKAGGIGMRNYWAKVLYNTLDEMGDKYKDWKKTNGL